MQRMFDIGTEVPNRRRSMPSILGLVPLLLISACDKLGRAYVIERDKEMLRLRVADPTVNPTHGKELGHFFWLTIQTGLQQFDSSRLWQRLRLTTSRLWHRWQIPSGQSCPSHWCRGYRGRQVGVAIQFPNETAGDCTGGLLPLLPLMLQAEVMLRHNLDVGQGRHNGARGGASRD